MRLAMAWGFHYDDVDPEILQKDLVDSQLATGTCTVGISDTSGDGGGVVPDAGRRRPRSAAVRAPVLVAMGERDVIADPKGEPRPYLSARSVDLFICPLMGHMHNFART